ncbi:hypothetical protein PG985_005709 [Apiospora marii]|uniref:uncharacterized protein n=1 Tax=Apiospora marii TaxID=335849 RepID=UPI003130A2AF
MREWEVEDYEVIIKDGAGDTTPLRKSKAFYVVAYGKKCGTLSYWSETKPKTEEYSGACPKHFRTYDQAKAFIQDWNQSYAEAYEIVLKQKLDPNLKPQDLGMKLENLPRKPMAVAESKDCVDDLGLDGLAITDE